jgi:hypothetical protein
MLAEHRWHGIWLKVLLLGMRQAERRQTFRGLDMLHVLLAR